MLEFSQDVFFPRSTNVHVNISYTRKVGRDFNRSPF